MCVVKECGITQETPAKTDFSLENSSHSGFVEEVCYLGSLLVLDIRVLRAYRHVLRAQKKDHAVWYCVQFCWGCLIFRESLAVCHIRHSLMGKERAGTKSIALMATAERGLPLFTMLEPPVDNTVWRTFSMGQVLRR